MGKQKEPIDLLLMKGKKNLTKQEIEERRNSEVQAPANNIKPPSYLSKKQKEEFEELAAELVALNIFSNLDCGELARYVTAHTMYARYTGQLNRLPRKKENRLRELRARLAEEAGELLDEKAAMDDIDLVIDLETKLAALQNKFFIQCEQTARALGLNITSRCKLVIPKPQEPKKNKFDAYRQREIG